MRQHLSRKERAAMERFMESVGAGYPDDGRKRAGHMTA